MSFIQLWRVGCSSLLFIHVDYKIMKSGLYVALCFSSMSFIKLWRVGWARSFHPCRNLTCRRGTDDEVPPSAPWKRPRPWPTCSWGWTVAVQYSPTHKNFVNSKNKNKNHCSLCVGGFCQSLHQPVHIYSIIQYFIRIINLNGNSILKT